MLSNAISNSNLTLLSAPKLATEANLLAWRLQTQRGYKITESDRQTILLPFSQIWAGQLPTGPSLNDLLEVGLAYEAAAFLIGWLTIPR